MITQVQNIEKELDRLESEHARMSELLHEHQCALVGLDLCVAEERLDQFLQLLKHHMHAEDTRVLPAYAELPKHNERATPDILRDEHTKIATAAENIVERAASLGRSGELKNDVLVLLESEMRFKTLLEHHTQREERWMLPALREGGA
jgi:septation ring formation regulator EzrA